MMRRRMILQSFEEPSPDPGVLPDGYRSVSYIESSGTQWIETGITPSNNTVFRLKVMNLQVTGNLIMGYWKTNDNSSLRLFNYSSRVYYDIPKGSGYSARLYAGTNTFPINVIKELELGNHYIKDIDLDEVIATKEAQETIQGIDTVKLNNYKNQEYSLNRWYYFKMFDGDTMLIDLLPCIRELDSKPGMYDLVSDTFFTNSGTGEFVIPS